MSTSFESYTSFDFSSTVCISSLLANRYISYMHHNIVTSLYNSSSCATNDGE